MFSRRRSRSHYDPQMYNAGGARQPPSASASAAANAFYLRQLGPSAAAEAIRRHSLDQNGANAMRDFQPGSPAAAAPRRANSLTTRSYQVVHTTPSRAPSAAAPRATRTPSYARTPSLSGGPARRNSLSSDRSNSLTRTQTVVNRDASGRTLSLTTTTIRQMGSFELVSTKDVPIASPSHHLRQQPSFTSDFGSRTNSLDSELVGIQEEPEEDAEALKGRLDRLGDPIEDPIAEELADEDRDITPVPETARSKKSVRTTTKQSDNTASKPASKPASKSAEPVRSPALAEPAEIDGEAASSRETASGETASEEDTVSASSVSDTTPSPASARGKADLHPPAPPSEPLHREVSPVRSALRNGNGGTPKTKVSFGETEEPYVYESYEYEDDHVAQPQGVAAATAAARSRPVTSQPSSLGASTNPMLGASAASAATGANSRRRLVMSQPVLHVEKRPSQTSLSGRTQSSVPHGGASMPYPHARPWDLPNEHFVDAPQSASEIPVPERSAARQRAANKVEPKVQKSTALGGSTLGSNLGANGLREANQEQDFDLDNEHEDDIRAQAIALAQATFQNQNQAAATGDAAHPSHHYRSLLEDDAASVRSESSFTRERRSAAPSRPTGGAPAPGRMRSLRQPATPTLRTNATSTKQGRKMSLLNQNPPNLDMGAYNSEASAGAGAGAGTGFRAFSLRNTQRPDPSTLLAGTTSSQPSRPTNGGGFRSRFADSDSDDEAGAHSGSSSKRSNPNGKLSLGDMFSPSTDVKDLFKGRATSDSAVVAAAKPRKKNGGFFKRMFGKREKEEVF